MNAFRIKCRSKYYGQCTFKKNLYKEIMNLRVQIRKEICNLLSEHSQLNCNAFKLTQTAEIHFEQHTGGLTRKVNSLRPEMAKKAMSILDDIHQMHNEDY